MSTKIQNHAPVTRQHSDGTTTTTYPNLRFEDQVFEFDDQGQCTIKDPDVARRIVRSHGHLGHVPNDSTPSRSKPTRRATAHRETPEEASS